MVILPVTIRDAPFPQASPADSLYIVMAPAAVNSRPGRRLAGVAVVLAALAVALPGPAAAEAVTRTRAIDWLTELFANYYVNARCNFVGTDDEAFVSDLELVLTRAGALSRQDLADIYFEARRLASVGGCDESQRTRVGRAYQRYRQKYQDLIEK